uniref:DNA-directed RNA polymerase III subunit RPC5-like n=1 Tax=Saccoglossus kowalevskii TaxID=10224 RepID=A0ABM0MEK6_SACKO|nr:PREDICTED: DNA-directed RNA polymerase III subunit RPC5-like [Saccoglossus kowalevskii]
MPYDEFSVTNARIKPKQQQIELEFSLDTNSPNYSKSKGEQIVLNVDGMNKSTGSTFTGDVMNKQILTSSNTAPSVSRYAAGLLKDGELHLTPLHGIVQLRPSFSYLDKADVRIKQEKAMENEGESSQDEVEEEAKPVMVKFARPETDQAKARRLASWQYLQQKQSQEMWVDLKFHHLGSEHSEKEYGYLYSRGNDLDVTEFSTSSKDYLGMLMPEEETSDRKMPQMPSNVLSMTQLKTMPLADQVRALLASAKVLQFSQLLTLISGHSDVMAVLRSLQQVAVLVQGCWVVKSDVLYPKDTISANSGVSAEILCRGRDYIMWRFTQSRYVVRKEVAAVTRLPSDDIKEFFEQMSRMQVNQGWQFILKYDQEFVEKYPEVVQRQLMLWDAKYQQLAKSLKLSKTEMEKSDKKNKSKETVPGGLGVEVISGKERVKQARMKAKSRADSNSHAGTEPVAMETETNSASQSNKMHHATSNHIDHNGPQSDVPSNQLLRTEVTNFVREKLLQQYILTISELRRMLVSKLAECPPGNVLSSGVSDTLLEECACDIGAQSLQLPWPNNTSVEDKRILALANHGDAYDQYRSVIIDMYQHNFKYRRNQFTEKFQETLKMEPSSKAEFDKIIKTCCVSRGAFWYLKGTVQAT